VPVSSVLAFWAVAAALIVVPGPDWAFAISAGLRRQVVPGAAGIMAGYVAMTATVASGLGLLIATTPAALTALTVLGGVYLVWLGAKTMRHPATLGGRVDEPTGTTRSTLLQGMVVSGLNPKGLLIFVALLPQFADQPFNARRVAELGAGIELGGPDALRDAVRRLLSFPEYADRARRVRDEIQALPPVDEAVGLLLTLADRGIATAA